MDSSSRNDAGQDLCTRIGTPCGLLPSQEDLERRRPYRRRLMIKSEAGFYKWLDCLDKMVLYDRTADKGGWVFRGQADARWGIKSSFERMVSEVLRSRDQDITENDLLSVERMMISKFRDRCESNFNIDKSDMMGWLCAMQHYGAPTRFIDFTVSPLVALYMAMKGQNPAANFSVWAVYRPNYQTVYNSRIPWLLSKSECGNALCVCHDIEEMSSRMENTQSNLEKGRRSNWECANCFLVNGKCQSLERNINFPNVLWITPEVTNLRLLNQGGLFLMPTFLIKTAMRQLFWTWPTRDDGQSAVEEFMKSKYTPMSNVDDVVKTAHLIQFVFSKKLSEFVSRFLTRANIRGSVLFPDLNGVAEEIGYSIRGNTLRFK